MDPELIAQFIEVTGESEAIAKQYLSLADGNVEMAISLMFEGARPSEPPPIEPEPEVRPPILPTQEILVPSDPVYNFPRLTNNVFDRFRDFAVETQRQEEEMARKIAGVEQLHKKMKRLEDLFRPPCNILFLGSFMEAREHAKSLNRWLLVNIQNPQEFSCQILNRDVWPNQQIQEIVKDHFVLWQVLSSTSDGKRYIDFYNVVEYPYLAIIDPRTGECMRTYNHITVDILISALNDMLSTHASPESAPQDSNTKEWSISMSSKVPSASASRISECSSSSKTSKYFEDDSDDTGISRKTALDSSCSSSAVSTSSYKVMNKRRKMEETNLHEEPEEQSSEVKPVQEAKPVRERRPIVEKVRTGNEPMVRLCLRLPSGKKETISMYGDDTVEDFLNKMEDMGYPLSEHTFLIPFPKTIIGELPSTTQLSDTILSPSNTVFISKI